MGGRLGGRHREDIAVGESPGVVRRRGCASAGAPEKQNLMNLKYFEKGIDWRE